VSVQGRLKTRETITNGFEKIPEAFIGIFQGKNIGKAVVMIWTIFTLDCRLRRTLARARKISSYCMWIRYQYFAECIFLRFVHKFSIHSVSPMLTVFANDQNWPETDQSYRTSCNSCSSVKITCLESCVSRNMFSNKYIALLPIFPSAHWTFLWTGVWLSSDAYVVSQPLKIS